mgnify:CR=1 FL=1|jgi:hypothetical protein
MSVLSDLADTIMSQEFDGDFDENTTQSIQAWLEENLGQLNILINTNYCLEDAELGIEESAVYRELYLYHYYSKRARMASRGVTGSCSESSSGDITSISDGESRVTFTNKNEVTKVLRGLANDAKQNMDDLIHRYNMYQSEPRQVGGIEAE